MLECRDDGIEILGNDSKRAAGHASLKGRFRQFVDDVEAGDKTWDTCDSNEINAALDEYGSLVSTYCRRHLSFDL